jgi:hypothetical protein
MRKSNQLKEASTLLYLAGAIARDLPGELGEGVYGRLRLRAG